jgi:DNA polymerase-3 subunit gamma/tau
MENYIVSARKYRPDTFESVVGQENITRTLKNAIRQQHLAQAYLFCGPRGVGKTTNARIFAKTINCYNLDENTNPCNECESCQAFNNQRSMNIHELDAASNNSVEDIRNLIDQVRIPPQIGKYSVYIIDEVHMLSSAAFNAFLKTLEEPPKHAVFILATTEKHKILPTILSRCQVFDFNRISVKDITSRLQFVANEEGINAEEEALQIIAQKADGAMRDGLSIFDQIVSFSGKDITYQNAIENLNVLDSDYYFKLTESLLAADHIGSILIFNEILNKGFEGNYFITGLASHFRDLLISRDQKSADLLEVGISIRKKYIEMGKRTPESFLIKSLEIASECDYKYKTSHNKRLLVELALIKMATLMRQTQEKPNQTNTVQAPAIQTHTTPTQTKAQANPDINKLKSETSEPKAEYIRHKKEKPIISETKTKETIPTREPSHKPMSFSLKRDIGKSFDKEKQEKVTEEIIDIETTNDFSEEDLSNAWNSFAEKHKDKPRLYQNLIAYNPKKKDDLKIEIKMPSDNLTRALNQLRGEILRYLQSSLKNGKIDLIVSTMSASEQPVRKAYTAEEKFKEMANSNPAIQDLRTKLDGNIR